MIFLPRAQLVEDAVARRPGRTSSIESARAWSTIWLKRPVEQVPQLAGRVAGARREHADHAHVAAERDGLDAVLGLPPAA